MIKPRALLIICSFCVASTAAAQDATNIRATEQTTYSRLVVPVVPNTEWEFTTFDRQAKLSVPGVLGGFDVSRVFDRIPKTRVLNITSDTRNGVSEISLSFACDCRAEASVSGRYIMIDVFDPVQQTPGIAETAAPAEVVAVEQDNTETSEAQAPLKSARAPSQRPAKVPASRPEAAPMAASAQGAGDQDGEEPAVSPDAIDVADHLINQLQRAADQGLVDLQPNETSNAEKQVETPVSAPPPEPALQPFEETADGMEALAKRLELALAQNEEDSISDAIRLQVPEEKPTAPGARTALPPPEEDIAEGPPEHCLDDYFYDFSVLEPNQKPVEQIIDLRARLLGEFDNPDATIALELARLYVALGMGVEARGIAREFLEDADQRAVLVELAQVVEGREMAIGSRLDKAAGCPGLAAVWRAAGMSSEETQPVPDVDDIVADLAALPVELRRTLVPRAVESFIRRGQIGAAEASFAILDRAPGNHGAEHEFQRAKLLGIGGEILEAEAIYLRLSKRNDPLGPRALMALVSSLVERGRRVPPDLIADLSSLARHFRDDPLGTKLRHSEILAKAGNGRFGEALSVVSQEIKGSPDLSKDYIAVADDLFLTTGSADVSAGAYATAVFNNMGLLTRKDVSETARLHVAQQLIDLGLPGAAIPLISPALAHRGEAMLDEGSERSTRLALSRAYLSMDEPEKSLQVLPPNPTDAETDIRIAALTKLGRHEAALAEAKMLNTPTDVASLGFRAGDWSLASGDPNLNGALARYMLRASGAAPDDLTQAQDPDLLAVETPTQEIQAITLELAETVRKQSESLRRAISSALEDPA